jgi:hypothetical protein
MIRPFDISDYILDEIFKEHHNKDWPAGAFDYQMKLMEMPKVSINQICKWLSINCTKNYIVSMDTMEILSGGTNNNRLSWKQRKRNKRFPEKTSTIKIRLDCSDIMLFRMVWVS